MKTRPGVNFDGIARPYRWMEYLSFGRSLERCRFYYLPQLRDRRRALVLGDGDGRFLAKLLAANPALQADAVDISRTMLNLLAGRAAAATANAAVRLRIHQANALAFTPEANYDLIVTHFFLDCLTQVEVESIAYRLGRHASPKAVWVVSDFRIPSGAMAWPERSLVRLLYAGFRLLTGLRTNHLPDHSSALLTAGFVRRSEQLSLAGLLTSEIWEYAPTMLPPQKSKTANVLDPVPDPEPASPSLPEPDPGVFHHQADAADCEPYVERDQ